MKRRLNVLIVVFSLLTLSACDMDDFNSVFRSPYIVDIGSIESMEPNKWYEFSRDFEAINSRQQVRFSFIGSDPQSLDMKVKNDPTHRLGQRSEFETDLYPNKKIKINVFIYDEAGKEYEFEALGKSSAILLYSASGENLKGKKFKAIKVRSNLNLKDIEITWISTTGK